MLLTVDTLAFALADVTLENALKFLMLDICDFETGKGFNKNYNSSIYMGGIRIGYDNFTTRYTVYVYMSGAGCRTYETYQKEKFGTFDWFEFIFKLYSLNSDFDGHSDPVAPLSWRRIDIACDDRSGNFDIRTLVKYYESHKIAGKARTFRYTLGAEESFYAGSPQSDHFLRIYNKLLERGFKSGDQDPWIRVEWQLRDDYAAQLISSWVSSGGNLSRIFCGYTHEFLRFLTKPNDGKNSQRLKTAPWWLDFLDNAGRIPFVSSPGTVYNIKKLDSFVQRQVASSIKTYLLTHNFDYFTFFDEFLSDDIRLNKDQLFLIKSRIGNFSFANIDYLNRFDNFDDVVSALKDHSDRFYDFKLQILNAILQGEDCNVHKS